MKVVTLLFLRRGDEILLAMKKRGFGAGKWNGVGGKVEQGEDVRSAAIRECEEEICVVPHKPQLVGRLRFFMPHDPTFEHDAYIYVAQDWDGEPCETEEMRPQWFNIHEIPFKDMWPDDPLWMPHLLHGELFEGTVNASETEVVEHHIKVVEVLE